MKNRLYKGAILLFLAVLAFGCSAGHGYGVLLWSPDESLIQTGSIVKIKEKSSFQETFLVKYKKEKMLVPIFSVEVFEKEGAAKKFRKEYEEFLNMYATCEKRGLPLREDPAPNGKILYKLYDGQKVKVLSKTEEKEKLGRFEGYWYRLLTEDGYRGYCFDPYLTIFTESSTGVDKLSKENTAAVTEDILFSAVWRPKSYFEDLEKNKINLVQLKEDYKIDFDQDKKTIKYKSEKHSFEISYDNLVKVSTNDYDFAGTNVKVHFQTDGSIEIHFENNGEIVTGEWYNLNQDIDDLVKQETEKREAVYDSLVNQFPDLESSEYGRLRLLDDNRFEWTDKALLIAKGIVTSSAGTTGTVSFNYHLGDDLNDLYSGVLTFSFDNGEILNCLYRINGNGLYFVTVAASCIEDSSIISDFSNDKVEISFGQYIAEKSEKSGGNFGVVEEDDETSPDDESTPTD